jgi:hypothetical protein
MTKSQILGLRGRNQYRITTNNKKIMKVSELNIIL